MNSDVEEDGSTNVVAGTAKSTSLSSLARMDEPEGISVFQNSENKQKSLCLKPV